MNPKLLAFLIKSITYTIVGSMFVMVGLLAYALWNIPTIGPICSAACVGVLMFWIVKANTADHTEVPSWQQYREAFSKPPKGMEKPVVPEERLDTVELALRDWRESQNKRN